MLVITRFTVEPAEEITFLADAERALGALEECPGFVDGQVGRATDDPSRWAIVMRWENVGAYRRALNGFEVRVSAVPLLARAVDEPTAFEVVAGSGATEPNRAVPRGSEAR
jgi:hypothetical protein